MALEITDYLAVTNFTASSNKSNKYIVVHYTANNGDTAMNNAKYFYNTYRGASAHYFVDENEIVRVVADSNTAWHCGTSGTYYHACRNSTSIGIEMCSRISNGTYYFKDEVVETTAKLVKELMDKYNISIDNVIRHYDVTRKSCPAPYVNETEWANFKAKVLAVGKTEVNVQEEEKMEFTQENWNKMYDTMIADKMDNDSSDWSKAERDWNVKVGIIRGVSSVEGEENYAWEKMPTREEFAVMNNRLFDYIMEQVDIKLANISK